jgi:7-cyano-7-deazaguanine synthase in queuosine biosynthesis
LFDEIDGSLPGTILAFNAALSNGHADFPDGSVKRNPNFYCIAAANTYWTGADRVYVGRNQLDGATLDRFIFIDMDYDESLERKLANNDNWTDIVQETRRQCKQQKIRHIVSPRASIMGAKLLAQGIPIRDVKDMVLFKGMDEGTRKKLAQG